MKSNPLENQPAKPEIGIYDCEVHLKFKLIEDKSVLSDRDRLLEMLLDAFSCGADEYLEPIQVHVTAQEISETEASARMRRQVIRLRNSSKLS
ncbi:MAG TPA: Npun_R1517 family heterocyst differentiation transcriptional regulator [Elainellaceae cyanobacterium]